MLSINCAADRLRFVRSLSSEALQEQLWFYRDALSDGGDEAYCEEWIAACERVQDERREPVSEADELEGDDA
jgi:hypothetical protein